MRKGLLIDSAFAAVLVAFGLVGLRTTYVGWWFLGAGVLGVVLGAAASAPLLVGRQPLVAILGTTVLAYVAAGSAVVDHAHALSGVVPTVTTMHEQALATVDGWKDLLTTLQPVASTGPLLIVPFILGLAGTVLAIILARRLRWSAAPLAAPIAVLATVIVLGTHDPGARLLDGLGFAVVALVWTAVRARRGDHAAGSLRASATRLISGGAVLALATLATWSVAGALPGSDTAGRVVLRDYVIPPFDLSDYPSPLVGYRKYTKDAKSLYDQTLFTVTGLPAGTPIRIATLDNYDGSVWGALNVDGDEFQRVGTTIPAGVSGASYAVHVTIAPAYAAAGDADVWLPDAGAVTGVTFGGSDAGTLDAGFRFNVTTSTGIVPARLRAGDSYTFDMIDDTTTMPSDARPFGPPQLPDNYATLVASRATQWTKGSTGIGSQIAAVASYFATEGAYTDGGAGETQYLPGHSVGRLTSFFNDDRPAGDDEQYAAALALIANYLGMPARVVLGAIPESDGTVRGSDVHAWVEVHLACGQWATIPDKQFVPPASRRPDSQPPTQAQSANAAVVPPPNTTRPPTSYVDDGSAATSQGKRTISQPHRSSALLGLISAILRWGGPPIGVLLAAAGTIVGLKALRRRRRRTSGSPANRCAQGWYELVDHARDLGHAIPSGWTRHQEAAALAVPGLTGVPSATALAAAADAAIYGPGDPNGALAVGYWRQVDALRKAMTAHAGRRQRFTAIVSIRSLRPRKAGSALEGVLG